MATIVVRKGKRGVGFQVLIRRKGVKLSRTFQTKGYAQEWARRYEGNTEAARALGAPGAKMSLEELGKLYRAAGHGGTVDGGGNRREEGYRHTFWMEQLGPRHLGDVTPAVIEGVLDEYTETGVSNASRNRMRSALSAMFRYAKQKHLFMSNPCTEVAKLPEPKGRTRWLTEDEIKRLLGAAEQSKWDRLHLLVVLALGTGARAGELVEKLLWQSIDWKARTALIRDTKNGTDRTLTLPHPVVAELMQHRKSDGLVFGRDDDPAAPFTWRKHWNRAVRTAKLKDFRFHDLRHTTASAMVSAGESLYNVGAVLGHKSPQSTARYAHLSVEAKQKSTDRVLGAMLRGVEK